jgi:hypothetical protein
MLKSSVVVAVLFLAHAAPASQKEERPSRPPKKGDAIVVRGCLTGQALEATELGRTDSTGALSNGLTFRLTGDKNLLKQMREEADGKVVDVEGILRSELPSQSVATRKVGRMRITIGSPAASPNSQEAETRRSLPVLEVRSFNGSTTSCGR